MSRIKAIISDADGTLVNTIFLIRHGQYEATAEYLLTKGLHHHEIPPYEEYRQELDQSVGGSTRETFEKTLKRLFSQKHPELISQIDFNELDRSLGPIQDRLAPLYVHPFHGLTELFSWAGQNKIKLGIFTSGSPHHIIRNFGVSLPVLGYTDLFHSTEGSLHDRLQAFIERAKAVYGLSALSIVTCEDVTKTKPDPEGVLKLLDSLAVSPSESLALGDHSFDMQAATAANVHPLGILHGFGDPESLRSAGAIRLLDDIGSLPQLIEAHNREENKLF